MRGRFLGLGLGDRVPDAKTVWLYREALAQAGKVDDLFKLFDKHLARQGYIARGGQILDASIVPVPRNHNTREENAAIKEGKEPPSRAFFEYPAGQWGGGKTSQPSGRRRMLTPVGPRNMAKATTATRTM
jgi:IS5 family transposase